MSDRDESANNPEDRDDAPREDVDARGAAADDVDPARAAIASADQVGDALPPSKIPTEAVPTHQVDAAIAASTTAAPKRRLPWWYVIVGLIVVEFWVYGRRGYVDVCVGKEQETDFSLVGKERTDANRWAFPRCEHRLNVGLFSRYDESVEGATAVACRGATVFRHQGEGKACTQQKSGWIRHVEARHVPPWHAVFYEHLFWFLY